MTRSIPRTHKHRHCISVSGIFFILYFIFFGFFVCLYFALRALPTSELLQEAHNSIYKHLQPWYPILRILTYICPVRSIMVPHSFRCIRPRSWPHTARREIKAPKSKKEKKADGPWMDDTQEECELNRSCGLLRRKGLHSHSFLSIPWSQMHVIVERTKSLLSLSRNDPPPSHCSIPGWMGPPCFRLCIRVSHRHVRGRVARGPC